MHEEMHEEIIGNAYDTAFELKEIEITNKKGNRAAARKLSLN